MRDRLPDAEARCLIALLRVYARDGRATTRAVKREDGRALSTVHYVLVRLRRRGLVAWTDGEQRTLVPRVWPVTA